MTRTAGLDVGGAHLKVSVVEAGRCVAVAQYFCPLWQGLDKLDAALSAAEPMLARANRFAVTMTGELSDLFETRREGVATLVERLSSKLGSETHFWLGARGFGTPDCAIEHYQDVGSTNFLATAELVARSVGEALLVDFGSTTADIVPIVDSKPVPLGLTDAVRQTTGELVYTGLTRTAVMAVTDRAPFQGQWVSLAREYLATMADVRRMLGELDEGVDLHATADGRSKSIPDSAARLARMLGREASDGTIGDWRHTARYIAECQLRSIHDGMMLVLSRQAKLRAPRLITAGVGSDAAAALGLRMGLEPQSFGELIDAEVGCIRSATRSAPAVAVAMLLGN